MTDPTEIPRDGPEREAWLSDVGPCPVLTWAQRDAALGAEVRRQDADLARERESLAAMARALGETVERAEQAEIALALLLGAAGAWVDAMRDKSIGDLSAVLCAQKRLLAAVDEVRAGLAKAKEASND